MQEISKKDLLSLIVETNQQVDEFADWKKMRGEVKKFEKILDDQNNLVGWNIKGTPILFTCGSEIDEFMETHGNLIEQLKEKFGDSLKWEQGNLPGCQPRRKMSVKNFPDEPGGKVRSKKIVTSWTGPETNMKARERILRKLNGLIVEKLENPEVTKHLELCSIPTIKGRERTHIDRYSEISNEKIIYKTHTFNSYQSAQDFLKAVMGRIRGQVPENMKTYYLARQFNKIYKHWEETKKNKKEYQGLTDIYQLEKYGLTEDNLDVTVAMFLEIQGQLVNNSYNWVIKLNTQHGKKLHEDKVLANLSPDKEIRVLKNAQLEPRTRLTDQYTALDSLSIVQSLIEGLDELVEKIMAINPKEALKLANLKRYDVQKQANEGEINKLIKNVIKEIKK
jgi:hypothetical protein